MSSDDKASLVGGVVSRVRVGSQDGYLINTKSGSFFQRTDISGATDRPLAPHEHMLIDLCEVILTANKEIYGK